MPYSDEPPSLFMPQQSHAKGVSGSLRFSGELRSSELKNRKGLIRPGMKGSGTEGVGGAGQVVLQHPCYPTDQSSGLMCQVLGLLLNQKTESHCLRKQQQVSTQDKLADLLFEVCAQSSHTSVYRHHHPSGPQQGRLPPYVQPRNHRVIIHKGTRSDHHLPFPSNLLPLH